jgi:hypothetical protein
MTSRLHQLSTLGQSVWIDFLSRQLLESGALARAVEGDAGAGSDLLVVSVAGQGLREDSRVRGDANYRRS